MQKIHLAVMMVSEAAIANSGVSPISASYHSQSKGWYSCAGNTFRRSNASACPAGLHKRWNAKRM